MQQWLAQALENQLQIKAEGPCQLCKSDSLGGLEECVAKASEVTHHLDHARGVATMTIFLCVDAHALQHPEIHEAWRPLFHLTRLLLILEENVRWAYPFSPLLNQVVTEYKQTQTSLPIALPPVGSRGKTTVTDLSTQSDEQAFVDGVWRWSTDVYNAYGQANLLACQLAAAFKKRNL